MTKNEAKLLDLLVAYRKRYPDVTRISVDSGNSEQIWATLDALVQERKPVWKVESAHLSEGYFARCGERALFFTSFREAEAVVAALNAL